MEALINEPEKTSDGLGGVCGSNSCGSLGLCLRQYRKNIRALNLTGLDREAREQGGYGGREQRRFRS